MPYDALVLAACVNEIKDELSGAKVNRVHQPDERTLIIRYYGKQGNGRLLLSAHPLNGRLHKTEAKLDNPDKAPLFVMVLRKWLEGARINDISFILDERIATIDFASHNDLGDSISLRLMIEIMGKHSNIILIDQQGTIIDGIRRYGSHLSRYREVLPGKSYLAPPPLDKLPFVPPSEEALAAALYDSEQDLAHALPQKIKGISPLLAKNISLGAGLDFTASCDSLGSYEISRLYQHLQQLQYDLASGQYSPTLIRKDGVYTDYYLFPLPTWQGEKQQGFQLMNQAVDAFYIDQELRQAFAKRQRALSKALRQRKNRLQKKINLQEADLANCEAAAGYKEAGDLLAANLYYLKRGLTEIELPSFSEEGVLVKIALDPAKTPQQNIRQYYKRYTKVKNARQLIENQLEINCRELDYLLSIEQALEDSCEQSELDIIEREAIKAGFIPPKAAPRGQKKEELQQLPPRQYRSADGFTMLIGRNNRQNDHLSLRIAQAEDIWLHAQKIPGSHVLVIAEGKQIPDSTIAEAAQYAAWFSKARESGKTAVDYTFAKNLKKPSGAVPGYLSYSGQKTVYVEPKNPDA